MDSGVLCLCGIDSSAGRLCRKRVLRRGSSGACTRRPLFPLKSLPWRQIIVGNVAVMVGVHVRHTHTSATIMEVAARAFRCACRRWP